jgi:Iodothyronine deiodinase
MESNVKDKVVLASPKTEEERAFVAGACVRKLGIEFPAVLDEFGNSTERAYTSWPDRIYLIDSQGRIAYKSKPGPFGFNPDQLATALSRALPAGASIEKSKATHSGIGSAFGPGHRRKPLFSRS